MTCVMLVDIFHLLQAQGSRAGELRFLPHLNHYLRLPSSLLSGGHVRNGSTTTGAEVRNFGRNQSEIPSSSVHLALESAVVLSWSRVKTPPGKNYT